LLLELGDVLFYTLANTYILGFTFEDLMKTNMEKLNKRIQNETLHATESRKDEQ